MNDVGTWGVLRKLDSSDVLLIAAVLFLAWLLAAVVRGALRSAAEKSPPRLRLWILRVVPLGTS